jgi:hypothetical protein
MADWHDVQALRQGASKAPAVLPLATIPNPAMPTPTQPLSCDGALSDLILQAARQALPANPQQLIRLPDCGERNRPLMPLLVGLIDSVKATAGAVADNAWDAGQPPPADLIVGLLIEIEHCASALRRSLDAF